MVHRCGQKPSGEEVSFSLRYSRIMDRLNKCTILLRFFLGHKIHPCFSTNFVSEATMVVSGFGPYHHLVHDDAPTERAGVILTPWVMSLALGLGAIHLGGDCHLVPSQPCICPISW